MKRRIYAGGGVFDDPQYRIDRDKVYKIWIIGTLAITISMFICIASITIFIDPLFHYHAPLEKYQYPINDERYQNDGITRNFDYDSIITGTSMTENFMKSEADEIYEANFIKVPFSGASYREINDNLQRAYDAKKKIRYVIRSLDYEMLALDKDATQSIDYICNDNIFDDLNYLLNKSIFFEKTRMITKYTEAGNVTTSFDTYANWNSKKKFGAEAVLDTYTLEEKSLIKQELTSEEREILLGNISQNVTDLASKHPETTFYYFFTPYSICYWDQLSNDGKIEWHLEVEKIAIEEILKIPNIKLYSFCNNYELVCNLDNYTDWGHYGEWINSEILEWMKKEEYILKKDNYRDYLDEIRKFYSSYDYSLLRK